MSSDDIPEARYWSISRTARYLGVPVATVQSWVRHTPAIVPTVRLGHRRLVDIQALRERLDAQLRERSHG